MLREARGFVTSEQINLLRSHIQGSNAPEDERDKALLVLQNWEKSAHYSTARAWGLRSAYSEGLLPHRFWGLYNLRPQGDKWVWLSWDILDERLVMVKELHPELDDLDKSNRIHWEIDVYNDFRDLQDRRVAGVPAIIEHGRNWFAASYARLGSLQWHFFKEGLDQNTSNNSLFHNLYPENPFETGIESNNWRKIRTYFSKTAKTLYNFHLQGIVHRDIRPENLLLDYIEDEKELEAWICDFDRARNFQDIFLPKHLNLVSEGPYTPPERLHKPLYSSSALQQSAYYGLPEGDVYSLAAVLCDVVLKQQYPNPTSRYHALQKKRNIPLALRQLLLESLHPEMRNRPHLGAFAERLEKITWRTTLTDLMIPLVTLSLLSVLAILLYIILSENSDISNDCAPLMCLSGELQGEDLHWKNQNTYRLQGIVYVNAGTLTIEAGTRIVADSTATLIISRDAQIAAEGRPDQPIVFSSSQAKPKPGDWGGIVILGKAPVKGKNYLEFCTFSQLENQPELCYFGGDEPDHSSGVFRYVRIEYAGDVLVENQETNGLTLAGVGRGSRIDHVLVTQVNDDCFEFFGGTFEAKYLVCHDPEDDGFDWESGYMGTLRNLIYIAKQHQYRSFDEKGRYALEGGDATVRENAYTGPEISNITLFLTQMDSLALVPQIASWSKDTRPFVHNLLALGYPAALCKRPAYSPVRSWLFFPQEKSDAKDLFTHGFVPRRMMRSNDLSRNIAPYYGAIRDSSSNWLKGKWGKIQ